MGEKTGIAWTHHTFNPWHGCARVSPGCENCYAEAQAKRFGTQWGPKAERRFFGEKHWNEPLKWDAAAKAAGERRRVFCASMADVFEDREDLRPHRKRLYELIEVTPHLDWLLLTKRPENARGLWLEASMDWPEEGPIWSPNVWIGTTVEDQSRAEERIPHLLRVPAAVRFLSCEPLLEGIDLAKWITEGREEGCETTPSPLTQKGAATTGEGNAWPPATSQIRSAVRDGALASRTRPSISWVIVGGESGPGARSFDLAWARSIVEQCRAASARVFVKQMGSRPVIAPADAQTIYTEQLLRLRHRKGANVSEWPPELRVREFPEVRK